MKFGLYEPLVLIPNDPISTAIGITIQGTAKKEHCECNAYEIHWKNEDRSHTFCSN